MNDQQKIDFKNTLKKRCIEIIEQRISSSYHAMENAQAAANEEEKSSAGDKYETGRAMNHLEKDMHARQLSANKKDMAGLLSVNCSQIYDRVMPGCFVKCTGISFFIAAGLGKIIIEEEIVFLLSHHAPVTKMLYNKKAGDKFLFNGKELKIEDLY
jgi:transcription elongation GreA/GreB family factor